MAQGTIDAHIQMGWAPSIRDDYDHAGAAALQKLMPLGLSPDSFLDWIRVAVDRWKHA